MGLSGLLNTCTKFKLNEKKQNKTKHWLFLSAFSVDRDSDTLTRIPYSIVLKWCKAHSYPPHDLHNCKSNFTLWYFLFNLFFKQLLLRECKFVIQSFERCVKRTVEKRRSSQWSCWCSLNAALIYVDGVFVAVMQIFFERSLGNSRPPRMPIVPRLETAMSVAPQYDHRGLLGSLKLFSPTSRPFTQRSPLPHFVYSIYSILPPVFQRYSSTSKSQSLPHPEIPVNSCKFRSEQKIRVYG